MKNFICKKCGSPQITIREVPPHHGLYCIDCGAWITWLSKQNLILAEHQIQELNENNEKSEDYDRLP